MADSSSHHVQRSSGAPPGIIIAAPASASGKTTITLALLRALRQRGLRVASMKIGPDFIDPMFHQVASGRACVNLDDWAMSDATFEHAVTWAGRDAELVIAEGVMGLFDGSGSGRGSTADVAARLGWPVLLVLDVSGMAASAAAMARGFMEYRDDVNVAGVILNRLGSPKHRSTIEEALEASAIPMFGALGRDTDLALPSRHLGLVQAAEHPQLNDFVERAADWVSKGVDLDALVALARAARTPFPGVGASSPRRGPLPPLGQRIAVACDAAFGFNYALTVEGWREQGAEIVFFSPLADESPPAGADAVYLPGGYPELHAGRLGASRNFLGSIQKAAARGAHIYGECGGFMVLGNSLRDADGTEHSMCGLLPVSTSFANPRMNLGYRQVRLTSATALGAIGQCYRGHEFHFARIVELDDSAQTLFDARNAAGEELGCVGLHQGGVFGSFIHLVDRAD